MRVIVRAAAVGAPPDPFVFRWRASLSRLLLILKLLSMRAIALLFLETECPVPSSSSLSSRTAASRAHCCMSLSSFLSLFLFFRATCVNLCLPSVFDFR